MGMVNLVAVAIVNEAAHGTFGQALAVFAQTPLGALLPWATFILSWLVVARVGLLVTDNRPRLDIRRAEIDPQI